MHTRLIMVLIACVLFFSCGSDVDEVYLSGIVDVENVRQNLSGPLMLIVTNTADLSALKADPQTAIVGAFGIDAKDPYFHIDVGSLGKKAGEVVYLFAFIDSDFNGIPSPGSGDFIGYYINRKTYRLEYELKKGENRGLDISINRMFRDFNASIVYAIDKGDVTYGKEFNTLTTEEVVLAVHEKGMQISINSAGTYDIRIDPDYIIGFTRFQPPAFDVYSGERPKPYATPKSLEIMPAIHVQIAIENEKIVGNVYLIAIIDENGNGEIETDDDVGSYNEKITIVPGTCNKEPGDGTVCPPPVDYYYPKEIEVHSGENRDASNDDEPYWIMYRVYQPSP